MVVVKGLVEQCISIVSTKIKNKRKQYINNASRKPVKRLILLLIILSAAGCVGTSPAISTKVVDAQSGQPVEGAVVLLNWTTSSFTYEPTTSDYRSFEAISSENGVVDLPGMFDAGVGLPDVFIYKRGYVGWQSRTIFPEDKKRYDFGWHNGYKFKLKRFEKGLSIKDHRRFITSYYLPYKTEGELYRKAINGRPIIRLIEEDESNMSPLNAMRAEFFSRYPRERVSLVRTKDRDMSDELIKRVIDGLSDPCGNQAESLEALAEIPSENPTIQAYLPGGIEAIIDQWRNLRSCSILGRQARIKHIGKNSVTSTELGFGESNDIGSSRFDDRPLRVAQHYVFPGDVGQLGPIVAPVLRDALADAEGRFRYKLIIALGYTGAHGVGDILVDEYYHHSDTRQASIRAMGILGESRFIPMIVAELTSGDKAMIDIATGAAVQLIRQADPQAMVEFTSGLTHQNRSVRDISFMLLSYYNQPQHSETVTALLKLIHAPDPETRQRTVELLGVILNNDEVVPALIRAIQDSNDSVQKSAITALGNKSGQISHEALTRIYNGKNEELRYLAGRALLESGIPKDELLTLYEYNQPQ